MKRMRDGNKDRIGYKKTKVGWIPHEWKCLPAGKLFDIQLGKMLNKKARIGRNPQPYLANYNVRWGMFDLSDVQEMHFNEKEITRFKIQRGDLLVCEGGEVGRCAVWQEQINPCFYQKALHRVRSLDGNVDIYFIMYFLHHAVLSPMMVNFVGHSSIAHFTREKFVKFPIALPPLPEQKQIVEILSTWDTAINQTRKLISQKQNKKKALMEKLLWSKTRLPGFKTPWKEFSLGKIFDERKETNGNHLPMLAITGKKGVILASEIDRKDSSNSDKSKYKRIYPGDIGYNTMRMWQGVSAVSYLEGIVSPAYTICKPKNKVDVQFIWYLFKSPAIIELFRRYSQGLVGDTLNLKFHHFAQIRVKIPDIEEQKKIAMILLNLDAEIKCIEKKISVIEKQKRGLMQKLITGEVRVNP